MTIIFSEVDYWELWEESYQNTQRLSDADSSEIILECPQQLGKGYRRQIQLQHGIDLLIHNYDLYENLSVEYEAFISSLEFGFQISGDRNNRDGRSRSAGQNFLQSGASPSITSEELAGKQILQIDIHLENPSQLNGFIASEFEQLPLELKQLIEGGEEPYDYMGRITPVMQIALEQILNCPYQGLTKQIYLEGKCWELIALRLEQLIADYTQLGKSCLLQPDDIDRIHLAKEILIRHLDNPPSLLGLARQVGLNDYKLKRGFRQVFGTTVFGYLHAYRMEKARILLAERQMKAKDVAKMVGYASHSRFTAAFKRKFGVSPSVYLTK